MWRGNSLTTTGTLPRARGDSLHGTFAVGPRAAASQPTQPQLLDSSRMDAAVMRSLRAGDMKPSNVMVSEEGVRLFDFGLGQAQEGVLHGLPQLSRKRFNAWTPGYAAPELLEGQPMATSADIYGVACVIYELTGGKHPFRRLPSTQARDEHVERELQAPANLPKHCWPALRSALAFDAADRTITATQLRNALGATSSLRQRLRLWP